MVPQHVPPQDIETEASCLAAILLSKEALLKVIGILQPEDFYLEGHRSIYEAILELDRKNAPIDLLTVKAVSYTHL
ncbi:MAG: replicative DNA helicase, partial [Spirochaetes bacterium]|nr:replicative DNA helicase [Spirochaetota bacterium]